MDDPLPGPLQPPEKLGEGGRKKKELLTRIAGRLEQQLHALQVVLAAEGAAHRRATARVEALQVILLARAALQQLLQQGDCPAPVLAALDTQALQLGTMCCGEELGSAAVLSSSGPSDRSTATTFRLQPSQQAPAAQAPLQRGGHHQQGQDHHRGPGPCMGASTSTATLQPSPAVVVAAAQPSAAEQAQAAAAAAAAAAATAATAAAATAAEEAAATSPSPDTAASAVPPPLAPPPPLPPRRPPPTAVGVPASVFIKSAIAAAAACPNDRGAFIVWWRERVMRLAMVVHQFRNSAATRAQLQELLLCMGAHLCGALLSRPWAVGLLLSNLDSGAETEPPPGWWERVTKCMGLRPEMIELLLFLQDWWRRSSGALSLKRRALAGRAPDLAGSFGLQHALCARLATLNSQYLVDAVALALMAHVALLTPEQLAEVYIGSWPRLPSASQLFGAVAAAAAGTPAAR